MCWSCSEDTASRQEINHTSSSLRRFDDLYLAMHGFLSQFQISQLNQDIVAKAISATELLLIRDKYLTVPGFDNAFTSDELNDVIRGLVT